MSANERRLLIAFGVVAGAIVLVKVVYPSTIKPAFQLSTDLAQVSKECERATAKHSRLEADLEQRYKSYVLRTGGTDVVSVEQDMLDSVFDLIQSSQLRDPSINPKNVRSDRKHDVDTVLITFRAKGPFRKCVEFVRLFYELPYVARLDDLKITPTAARGKADHDECTISGEIQALVLPMVARFGPPDGEQPRTIKKYAKDAQGYGRLAMRKPFTPYNVYVQKPPVIKPPNDAHKPPPTPPQPAGPPGDPAAADTVVRMVLRYGVDEVRVVNTKSRQASYVTLGQQLDKGELVLVHPRGVVTHKVARGKDFGYYVYPLGARLADRVPLEQATDQPEILLAMRSYLQAHTPVVPESETGDGNGPTTGAGATGAPAGNAADGRQGAGGDDQPVLDDRPDPEPVMGPPLPPELISSNGSAPVASKTSGHTARKRSDSGRSGGPSRPARGGTGPRYKPSDWMNKDGGRVDSKRSRRGGPGGVKRAGRAKKASGEGRSLKKAKRHSKTTRPDE